MRDLAPFFKVERPVFDTSPDGLVEQISNAMHYLETEYAREVNVESRGGINSAYVKLMAEIKLAKLYVSTSIQ